VEGEEAEQGKQVLRSSTKDSYLDKVFSELHGERIGGP
jgi:hypothetical protein